MKLLLKEGNQVYAIVLPGAKILLALFAVFCTIGAIRLDGITAIALSSIGISTTIFLGIMVSTLAEVHSRSGQVLRFLRNVTMEEQLHDGRPRRGCLKRSVNALGEIRIQIGSLYFIDKGVVLLLLRAVTEITANYLIATK